jgi:hypothetical protein
MAVVPSGPALGACLQSGNTVTCSGTTNTGFGTGAENNLTVTVQPDASINVGAAQRAINLADGNTAINNGTIVVGNGGVGMEGLNNNIFTNNGGITVGAVRSACSCTAITTSSPIPEPSVRQVWPSLALICSAPATPQPIPGPSA